MQIVVKTTTTLGLDGYTHTTTEYEDSTITLSTDKPMPVKKRHSEELRINYREANDSDLEALIDLLIANAKKKLQPGAVFEVRSKPIPRYGALCEYDTRVAPIKTQCERFGMLCIELKEDEPKVPLFRRTLVDAANGVVGGYIVVVRAEA